MTALAIITSWDMTEWLDEMRTALPGMDIRGWPELGDLDEITYAAVWKPPAGLLATMPHLKVIFCLGAGVDALLSDTTLPTQIPVVRVVDADLTSRMSEYVLLQVLMHHREQRRLDANQVQSKWDAFPAFAAKDFNVGIMGLGVLGQDAARKLLMMGYNVRGWSRTPKVISGVECFSGEAKLGAFLSGTDILVCLLPATPDTEGILNRALFQKLSRMGPFKAPILINAGRGKLQVEADILSCLDDGTLHSASLDVFSVEPLPENNPFWRHPKVMVTPHSAADSNPKAICEYIARQVARFEVTRKLDNIVDISKGY